MRCGVWPHAAFEFSFYVLRALDVWSSVIIDTALRREFLHWLVVDIDTERLMGALLCQGALCLDAVADISRP